jgi:hypothetical protein
MNQELFYPDYFPKNEKQLSLLESFKSFRKVFGQPEDKVYQQSLMRTKPFTRTVYPPEWKNQSGIKYLVSGL